MWKEKYQVLHNMFLAPYIKNLLLDASEQLALL